MQLKIIAALSLVLVLVGTGMGLWVKSLKVDKAAMQVQLDARDGVIVKQNGVIGDQANTIIVRDLELAQERAERAAGDKGRTAAADTTSGLTAGSKENQRRINDAPNLDGPAAPVLGRYADELREFAARYRALRTGDRQTERLPEVRDSAGPPETTADRLTPGFTQGAFGAACIAIKNSFADLIGKNIGIATWQTEHNGAVDALNSKAAALAAAAAQGTK